MTYDRGKYECVKALEKAGASFVMPLSSAGYHAPDVFFACRNDKRYVVEVKTSHSDKIYIDKEQIKGLIETSRWMSATAIIVAKFIGTRKGFRYF